MASKAKVLTEAEIVKMPKSEYMNAAQLKFFRQALASIDDGTYGYCEETGEPIGIQRLLARPTATLTIEAQERREMKQKMFGE
jgi:RNA polymerase-binding transcription factor DksA